MVLSRAKTLGVAPQERDEGNGMARRHLIITRSVTGMMLGDIFYASFFEKRQETKQLRDMRDVSSRQVAQTLSLSSQLVKGPPGLR